MKKNPRSDEKFFTRVEILKGDGGASGRWLTINKDADNDDDDNDDNNDEEDDDGDDDDNDRNAKL